MTHLVPKEGIPDFFRNKNTIFLLEKSSITQSEMDSLNESFRNEDIPYVIKSFGNGENTALANYIGGDIVLPLFDIENKIRGYLISNQDNDTLSIIWSIVEVAVQYDREYLEEILIAAAFNEPTVFSDTKSDDSFPKDNSSIELIDGLLGIPIVPLGAAALGLDLAFDFDAIEGITDGSSPDSFDVDDSSANLSKSSSDRIMSSKRKRLLLSKLPEKVSERFIKKNPDCRKEIQALVASVSHQDLQEIVMELITKQKGALEIFDFEKLSAASEYELCVKQWDKGIKDFDHKFKYCLYLKDHKGKETPIKFQNHPAYCLYIMYVIDRAVRGENASYLSIRENKDEFIRLYQVIFGFPKEDAENKYKTFAYRLNKEGTPTRKGRYDDYLKDIDETIVSLVGRADSIPLKLRDGGHLEIRPDRIKIDENLRSFKFK
jgi:hypothetical protein